MVDWIGEAAQALGIGPMTDQEVQVVLDLARDVSHGTGDRRQAPLSAFLAGVAAASAAPREEGLRAAYETILTLLPAAEGLG